MVYTNIEHSRVEMFDGSRPIATLKIGTVVLYHATRNSDVHDIGHIVGFNHNPFNELVVMVALASEGGQRGIHPIMLEVA